MTQNTLGNAKSDAFMLSTASIMIGAVDKLFKLNEANSVGLVKNFVISADHSYTDLTQGVKNALVYSVLTGSSVKASMEVYEYTMANIAYALGLEGATIDDSAASQSTTSSSEIAAPAAGALTAASISVASATGLTDKTYVTVSVGNEVFLRKVTGAPAGQVLTLDMGFPIAIPVGAVVKTVSIVGLGSKEDQPFLAAKVTGKLANGDTITIMIPKLRIVKGFNLAFSSKDFGNMPFEFSVFDLTPSDPFYNEFLPFGNAMLVA